MKHFFEWMNLWFTMPVAIVGFLVAIQQAAQAKNAARASKEASERAEGLLTNKQMILLIPILHRAEGDLENAIESKDRRLVSYHLSNWRWHSSQFRSYLGDETDDRRLAKAVQTSIALAAETKMSISDPYSDLADTCKPVQQAIAVVTGELGRIAANETNKAG